MLLAVACMPALGAEPTTEELRRALNRHFTAVSGGFLPRPCVRAGFHLGAPERAHHETEFDWTPASFLSRHGPDSPKTGNPEAPYAYLTMQGMMQAHVAADGVREYRMTWKGFGVTDGQGCFHTGGGRVEAEVLSTERAGAAWRVTAVGRPTSPEPWTRAPGFIKAFGSYGGARVEFSPRVYDIVASGSGYAVAVKMDPASRNPAVRAFEAERARRRQDPATVAAQAGILSTESVLAVLRDHMKMPHAPPNRICVQLPHMADDTNLGRLFTPGGGPQPTPYFTLYNLQWRPGGPGDLRRNHDVLERLRAAALLTRHRVAAESFRGGKADGALRYELTPAGIAMLVPEDPQCLLVGHVEVEDVVGVQQFDESTLRPRFAARTRFRALPGRDAVLARFGNFARLREEGGALVGTLEFRGGRVIVAEAVYQNPRFRADPATLADPAFR